MAEEHGHPSEEELLQAISKVAVADVLVNALTACVSLGFHRVSAEGRDLPQARLAIEALRALDPVLREAGVDEALVRDLEQARANLQLAYATAVAEASEPEGGERVEDAPAEDAVAEDAVAEDEVAEDAAAEDAAAEASEQGPAETSEQGGREGDEDDAGSV